MQQLDFLLFIFYMQDREKKRCQMLQYSILLQLTHTLTLITQYDGFETTESFWEGVQKLKYLTVEDSCNKTYT